MQKSRSWTFDEDSKLISLMQTFANNKWCVISQSMGSRSPVQCMNRWTKILKPGLLKGYWSKEEDEQLLEWIKVNGPKKWSECAKFMKKRSAKQCRERWLNHLDPNIKKDEWTEEEDKQIYDLYKRFGTSWSKLAREMKGRTENAIKNRFYSSIRSLIANENGTESYAKKEKKKVNKNQGFFNVLKENSGGDAKENIENIKRKMMSHSSIRDPLLKKKRCPEDFYESSYGKNFDGTEEKLPEEKLSEEKNSQKTSISEKTQKNEEIVEIKTKQEENKENKEKEKGAYELIENMKNLEENLGKSRPDLMNLQNDPLFKEFKQFRENMLLHQFEAFKTFMLAGNPYIHY